MDEKLFEQFDLLAQGDDEDGLLFFIDTHKDLLKQDPIRFIGNHISFYANKEDLIKSLQVVELYKSMPYISMEVEEFLNEMKEKLTKLNAPKKQISDDEIAKYLFSNKENAILYSLQVLSKKNIRNFLPLMEKFLTSNALHKYKTLALFILIEQHVDSEIKLIKDGLEYNIIPSTLNLPFDEFAYLDTKKYIESQNIDLEVQQNAIEILNTVQIKNFPDSILDIDEIEFMGDVFIEVSKSFFDKEIDYDNLENKYLYDKHKIKEFVNEIINLFNS